MRRRLLNLLTALSLLLCLAVLTLWAVSYFRTVRVARYSRPYDGSPLHTFAAGASDGVVLIYVSQWGRGARKSLRYDFDLTTVAPYGVDDVGRTWLGFGHSFQWTSPDMTTSHARVISVPCWFLAVTTASTAAFLIRARRRSGARLANGLCPTCGYDLRATPGRCPECGTGSAEVSA